MRIVIGTKRLAKVDRTSVADKKLAKVDKTLAVISEDVDKGFEDTFEVVEEHNIMAKEVCTSKVDKSGVVWSSSTAEGPWLEMQNIQVSKERAFLCRLK